MMNGAVVVSDFNQYLNETFESGNEIIFYKWTEINHLPSIVKNLKAPGTMMSEIAAKGKAKATDKHSWAARAGDLLKLLKETYGISI